MKGIIRSLIVLAAFTYAPLNSFAQTATKSPADSTKKTKQIITPVKPKGPKQIRHEASLGVRLNTNGWSIYTDLGKVKPRVAKQGDMFNNVRFWQLEVSEKKDPKEEKSNSFDEMGNQTTYIYGKINNFYAVKLGWGYRKMIVGKPDPGTVSIHWVNVFGPSLGLLKPYYLNVAGDPTGIRYSDATQAEFLYQRNIEGTAGFKKGLNQLSFNPGIHYKSGIHLDFSTNKKNVLGVETGFNVEYYSKPVPLMFLQKANSYFIDLFVAFQYGRRW